MSNDTVKQGRRHVAFDTSYSACSLEACPDRLGLFACGTYQVTKHEEQEASAATTQEHDEDEVTSSTSPAFSRKGQCLLFQANVEDDGQVSMSELQRFDGPAILDMKWRREAAGERPTLAIANAKGSIQLCQLNEDNVLELEAACQVTDESTLCLSLDWASRRDPAAQDLVVSLSDGSVAVFDARGPQLEERVRWHAHDFEPWIAAFDCWQPSAIWTGGDDCKLKGWDLRQGCETPTFVNKRFDGGVTSIQSHPLRENLLAVGSYDSTIRIFDRRKPAHPLATRDAGGGLWRLKWHDELPGRLLAAAMHDGFKVHDFADAGADEDGAVVEYREQESLAYGADWLYGMRTRDGGELVASCSFYDHSMHVWEA